MNLKGYLNTACEIKHTMDQQNDGEKCPGWGVAEINAKVLDLGPRKGSVQIWERDKKEP